MKGWHRARCVKRSFISGMSCMNCCCVKKIFTEATTAMPATPLTTNIKDYNIIMVKSLPR